MEQIQLIVERIVEAVGQLIQQIPAELQPILAVILGLCCCIVPLFFFVAVFFLGRKSNGRRRPKPKRKLNNPFAFRFWLMWFYLGMMALTVTSTFIFPFEGGLRGAAVLLFFVTAVFQFANYRRLDRWEGVFFNIFAGLAFHHGLYSPALTLILVFGVLVWDFVRHNSKLEENRRIFTYVAPEGGRS